MDIEQALETQLQNIERSSGRSRSEWLDELGPLRAGGMRHGQMVAWLKSERGLTHGNANLLARLAGSGDAPQDPAALVEAQYAGAKAALRPLYDRLVAFASTLGTDVAVDPKKGSVALRRSKNFAVITPAARDRIDLGLNLGDAQPRGRLEAAGGMCSHRVRLDAADPVDEEVRAWLREAYDLAVGGPGRRSGGPSDE
ncbi:DUF5655 domain-containing protein [Leucobacter sp. wl10]|uniref:DUF5655 domain-containing protein n=1 Tax=Leucobacter sp. wl10 TaxID=2304677 RepID=UPI000E5B7458|nr:DUF5655 domain-containing protein [Leucobacter sp. wl10]RGE23698.1 DUF4287 domain-containing protein [Leucobacter sp. wl10]